MKLHMDLRHNRHSAKVTPLQRLRSTILLPQIFRKTNLVILEAANKTCALIITLITQKNTDINVCKKFIPALFCVTFSSFIFTFFAHTLFIFFIFLFWGQIRTETSYQQKYNTLTNKV